MSEEPSNEARKGSSPVGRGGAGIYIEGELGAFYLLALLAGSDALGLPGGHIERIRFQGVDQNFALDDLVLHGTVSGRPSLLEIQSKRDIKFSPKDEVFKALCHQIARVQSQAGVLEEDHLLAAATQRTSFRLSGPYQDVLEWARRAETATEFFRRLELPGVASKEMRDFVSIFRANLVAEGVADDEQTIWRILKRFQILQFDFESSAPLARLHALNVARAILAPEDGGRREALWSTLIEIAIKTGKAGGAIDRAELRKLLTETHGFRLEGDREFGLSRAKLEEMAHFALADIGTDIGGFRLSRQSAIDAVDTARDVSRFILIAGGSGVGKSGVLRQIAERLRRETRIFVLDRVNTPGGGWQALAARLGVSGTADDFLTDVAFSGGAVLFVDGIDMFDTEDKRRTVNDLLRGVAAIDGFSVIVTARSDPTVEGDDWIAPDARSKLGPINRILIDELNDDEVEILSAFAPELRAILASGHPAAPIARNLYRLSRLLKIGSASAIRTEVELALRWWESGDGIAVREARAAQRLFANLADSAIAGHESIELADDSPARTHLIGTRSLREIRRDHVSFYHDVLRDWAIGIRIGEDDSSLEGLDLTRPASPRVARGVEFAARLALERNEDSAPWLNLLSHLSGVETHSSWRRNALMAIVRSELSPRLLERHSDLLLDGDGELLRELTRAIAAIDTIPTIEVMQAAAGGIQLSPDDIPGTLRSAATPAAWRLLRWCEMHQLELSSPSIGAVVSLVQLQLPILILLPSAGAPIARMLYGWLMQFDIRESEFIQPLAASGARLDSAAHSRLVEDLRNHCLLLASTVPDEVKAYLRAITTEGDSHKVKVIRQLSKMASRAAPAEMAALIEESLIERDTKGHRRPSGAFSYADSDYLPPSPSQLPFLDLLETAPPIGLGLIRRLTSSAIDYYSGGSDPGDDGYRVVVGDRSRFFPWQRSYFWSRGQGHDYSVQSALMALEAWGHARIEADEAVEAVIADVLGPEGSPAAYLSVALDLLLSHWPRTREALVPFLASPELLARDRQREVLDRLPVDRFEIHREPKGSVQHEHLRARLSRGVSLEEFLPAYIAKDETSDRLRALLGEAVAALGPYGANDTFGDPEFMGAYACNLVDPENWTTSDGEMMYRSPPAEAAHLSQMARVRDEAARSNAIEARIQLAAMKPEHGSAAVAKEAADYAGSALPNSHDLEEEEVRFRANRLAATAMLIARDGDDALLAEKESWVRSTIARCLEEKADGHSLSTDQISFNRPAMSIVAIFHLWRRRGEHDDLRAILNAAARDRTAIPAFETVLDRLIATDGRLFKSTMRIGLSRCKWRWHPWDEDEAVTAAYEKDDAAEAAAAVEAELAWLNGGMEPPWPILPGETPLRTRPIRIRVDGRVTKEEFDQEDEDSWDARKARLRPNPQVAAYWLRLLRRSGANWATEVVEFYADWSAELNGFLLGTDADVSRSADEWNNQYYRLAAPVMIETSEEKFEHMIRLIEGLPHKCFCDAAEALIQSTDAHYFDDPTVDEARPALLRSRVANRAANLSRWIHEYRPESLSIGMDMGGFIAALFMNIYNALPGEARSYLMPGNFDRIDPFLNGLRPLHLGGPTTFVALCTMNTMLVAPRPRHAPYLLEAFDHWYARLPGDAAMWTELGIGRKVVDWLSAAAQEDSALFGAEHALAAMIDTALGRLVAMGIAEAHELEARIAELRQQQKTS